jgi:UDP-N-acetylglucosamine acyltransferase
MTTIHPSAFISPEAELAPGVEIGPYCVLTGPVRLASGVRLVSHVQINGPAEIGEGTIVYPFASLGFEPQDYKFKPGMATAGIRIGANCIIRENVTVHAATKPDIATTLGDRVFMMVGSHVGHDCKVGNNVVMVNYAVIGGHVQLYDNVTMGGISALHQFCRAGRMAFLSGGSMMSTEIPPYCISYNRNSLGGLNLVGMRRAGIPREQITTAREAYRRVFKANLPRKEMVEVLTEMGAGCPPVAEMAEFVATAKRTITPSLVKLDKTGAASEDEDID